MRHSDNMTNTRIQYDWTGHAGHERESLASASHTTHNRRADMRVLSLLPAGLYRGRGCGIVAPDNAQGLYGRIHGRIQV